MLSRGASQGGDLNVGSCGKIERLEYTLGILSKTRCEPGSGEREMRVFTEGPEHARLPLMTVTAISRDFIVLGFAISSWKDYYENQSVPQ